MFQQKPEDRLRSWREFRATLDLLPIDQALAQTAEYWARVPFTPYLLDPDNPTSWPNPWTMIEENIYCDIAKCLGIVYTVLLTKHRTDLEFEIRTYEDNIRVYNLAWFNQGKYILNMIDSTVVNTKQLNKTLKLNRIYTAVELQLDNY